MRETFFKYVQKRENYGSVNDLSNVEDEGDGGKGVEKRMGNNLPITRRNKINYMKKCNCKKSKK